MWATVAASPSSNPTRGRQPSSSRARRMAGGRGQQTRLLGHAPPWLRRALSANLNAPAPAALGRPFEQD